MLLPWRFAQPLAGVRSVVHGANTLYLCAPRGELRHYESLFRGALRTVLEEQQGLFDEGRQSRLLLLLDEAATVAPLDDLDQLAATLSGLDVTLVTVAQDFAQLAARWGPRAATIVNNHTSRVVLAGLSDPSVRSYLPELVEPGERSIPLRRRTPGTAQVVAGPRPRDDRATASVVVEPASAGAWRASPLSTISQWPSGTSRARRPFWRLTSGATTIKYCPVDQAGQPARVAQAPSPRPTRALPVAWSRRSRRASKRPTGAGSAWVSPASSATATSCGPGNLSRPGGVTTDVDPDLAAEWIGFPLQDALRGLGPRRARGQRRDAGGDGLL